MRLASTLARSTWFISRLSAALVVVGLAAGCRSTQSAFQFRPGPEVAALPVSAPDSGAVTPVVSPAVPMPRPRPRAASSLGRSKPVQLRQHARQLLAQPVVAARLRPLLARPAAQAVRPAARPRHTQEAGLGTTVLGVLGLVVLPISLVGLLIWGGPVWAVLAGLAALAVLIAYLDPFA